MSESHESFVFEAAAADGRIKSGLIRAPSRGAASGLLTDRGLLPLRLERRSETLKRGTGVSMPDLAEGLHTLGTLLESGLPLARCLQVLESLAPTAWSSI